jgi:5-hydroxyisourate hydrolase
MGRLTTHVLDTARGRPAAGLGITLFRAGEEREKLLQATTNADGPLRSSPAGRGCVRGRRYEMLFAAGPISTARARPAGAEIPGRGGDPLRHSRRRAHYHVPLLLSPFGYSTYRGS